MELRSTCPDCESPLSVFTGLSAVHKGGISLNCDRVSPAGRFRQFDPCGFAVHLTREELIDAALRAAENKETD